MSFDERVLNGMSVFSAIVDTGSFARASDVLDMSQPGVSRAVARLEGRLGIRLFDRTTRSVTLTDEGRRFYEQVQPLLAGLEEAAASAAMGGKSVRGRLRVNLDPFFSRMVLGPHLGSFLDRYPELQLELITRDQLGDMVGDGFDLALRFGQARNSSLVARKLRDFRILTVATPDYIRRNGRPETPQALEDRRHTCVLFREPETGRPYSWEFHRGRKKIELTPQSQLVVNDAGTLYASCFAGYGIIQVMDLGVEAMLESGQLVDLFPDWPDETFPLYAYYPSRRHPPAKTRAFLDFIVSLCET
ncbi:MAG TPA: LysR family transcriptional regulator [Rhodocyclaceae bacterium]|nr:LysR family transcriptional regulator [Rhodocyclaceae bacterium]